MKISILFFVLFCCIATSESFGFISALIRIARVLARVIRETVRRGRNIRYRQFGNTGSQSLSTPLLTNQGVISRTMVSAGGRMGTVLKKIGGVLNKPAFVYGVVAADIASEVIEAIVVSAVEKRSVANLSDEDFEKSLRDWFPNQSELTELYTKEAEKNPEVYSVDDGLLSVDREEITEDLIESLAEMFKNLNINDKAELVIADEELIVIEEELVITEEELTIVNETENDDTIKTNAASPSCSACSGIIFLTVLNLLVILLI